MRARESLRSPLARQLNRVWRLPRTEYLVLSTSTKRTEKCWQPTSQSVLMRPAMRVIYTTIPIACALLAGNVFAAEADSLFEKSVRPLLERKCYDCHSARSDEVKGNLRLDSLEGILKGGNNGPAIVAGDVENSFLLRAIRYQE